MILNVGMDDANGTLKLLILCYDLMIIPIVHVHCEGPLLDVK
jgi:hypothetical protein